LASDAKENCRHGAGVSPGNDRGQLPLELISIEHPRIE